MYLIFKGTIAKEVKSKSTYLLYEQYKNYYPHVTGSIIGLVEEQSFTQNSLIVSWRRFLP